MLNTSKTIHFYQLEEKDSTIMSLNTEMEAMAMHSVDWHQTLE